MSFDAKSLLEALMKSQSPQQPAQGSGGGLGDLLGSLMKGGQGGGAASAAPEGGMGGLGDLLGKMMQGGGQAPQQQGGNAGGGQGGGMGGGMGGLEDMLRKMMPQGGQGGAPAQGGSASAGGMGGLGDILGKLGGGAGGAAGDGNITDILGQIFGQATQGVKEVGGRVEQATGVGQKSRDAFGQATGQSPEDMMAQLKDLIAKHQMGAGVAAAGVGAAVLGTKAGRSLAGSAVKVGALALIGGLAYKAYENYSQGRPPLSSGPAALVDQPAPAGTGFEPQAITNDSALLYIRAMIAAAAADGRIDEKEQQKILGGLKQAGVEQGAHDFLMQEINNPATVDELAAACKTGEEAVQVFTAARIAIDLDNQAENDFLVSLATKLGIDGKLAQHIDAAAAAQG
jgi:uncharacterized membrane protein YebE (DUF533 family)